MTDRTAWQTVPLGSVVGTIVPQRDKPTELDGPIPWLRIEDFDGKYLGESKSGQGVTQAQVAQMPLRVFPEGTVVCSCSCTMGATAIATRPLVTNQTFIGLVPGPQIDASFLYYLMQAKEDDLQQRASGSIQQYLSKSEFRSLRIPLPPVEEQRRIADFLDDQVARIDATVRDLLDARQGVDSRANVAVLDAIGFDPDASKRPKMPGDLVSGSSWPLVRLSLLARLGTGHTPSRSNPDYWQDCHIPWLTTSDIHMFRNGQITRLDDTTFHISDLGVANSAAVVHPAGTIAMSRTASLGFSIEMGTAMATSQDFVTWTCGPRLKPRYLLALLRATRNDLVRRLSYGSTHKTIYFPDVMSLRIPLPPMDIQDQILRTADQEKEWRSATQDAITRAVTLLEEWKRTVISAAVTGDLDVTTARPIGLRRWMPNVSAGVSTRASVHVLSSVGGTG